MNETLNAAGIEQTAGVQEQGAEMQSRKAPTQNQETTAQSRKTTIQSEKENVTGRRGLGELASVLKKPKALAGIVLIVAIVLGVVWINPFSSGYANTLDDIFAMMNHREEKLDSLAENMLPGFAYEQYDVIMEAISEVETVESWIEEKEDDIMDAYLELEDEFGSNAEVSWTTVEKEKMSDLQIRRAEKNYQEFAEDYLQNAVDRLDDYDTIRNIADRFDLSVSAVRTVLDSIETLGGECENLEIKKGYNLTIEIQVEGSRDSYSDEVELRMIYANGEWMLDYSELGGNLLTRFGEELNSIIWWL